MATSLGGEKVAGWVVIVPPVIVPPFKMMPPGEEPSKGVGPSVRVFPLRLIVWPLFLRARTAALAVSVCGLVA